MARLEMQPELLPGLTLCASSLAAWLVFYFKWTRLRIDTGKIRLPDSKADSTLCYDEDIPVDVELWKRRILFRKIACLVVAALDGAAWSVTACSRHQDTNLWFHVAFWVSCSLLAPFHSLARLTPHTVQHDGNVSHLDTPDFGQQSLDDDCDTCTTGFCKLRAKEFPRTLSRATNIFHCPNSSPHLSDSGPPSIPTSYTTGNRRLTCVD